MPAQIPAQAYQTLQPECSMTLVHANVHMGAALASQEQCDPEQTVHEIKTMLHILAVVLHEIKESAAHAASWRMVECP